MARQPRAEAVQTERRRRNDGTLDRTYHRVLAIPAEFRDDPVHEYRWANDRNSRLHDLTVDDDWNFCTSSKAEASDADRVSKVVDTDRTTGKPVVAYLLRKRKDWYEEDKRQRAASVSAQEDQLLKSPATDNPQAASTQYVSSGSSIRRGAYAP